MSYQQKNYEHLLGISGSSEQLLKNHFALYKGYVDNANKLNDILVQIEKEGKYGTPEYAELNRRFGWEFNGMRLHEYYFENISKKPLPLEEDSKLSKKIADEFGSYDDFEKDFKSMGAMRGIGWVILYCDRESKKLFNVWINEHDVGHLAGAAPLLVIDVFEHAYMLDYGLKKADYIGAFFKMIDWGVVEKRFNEVK